MPPPQRTDLENRNIFFFSAMARLKPGVTPAQAAAEATAAARASDDGSLASRAMLGASGPATVDTRPLLDSVTANVRPALLVLFAAVGTVLVIACANLASLLLSRGLARRRELAVRAALGAGRSRLALQLLVESLLLGVSGGLMGIGIASLLLRALPVFAPADFPRLDDIRLDGMVLAFAVAVAVLAACCSGPVPRCRALV